VKRVLVERSRVAGVELADGTQFKAPLVLSNATPKVTFFDLVAPVRSGRSSMRAHERVPHWCGLQRYSTRVGTPPQEHLPPSFLRSVQAIDYESGTFKINGSPRCLNSRGDRPAYGSAGRCRLFGCDGRFAVALRELPNFVAAPTPPGATAPQAHHQGTIHFEEHPQELHQGAVAPFPQESAQLGPAVLPARDAAVSVPATAYLDAKQGRLSERCAAPIRLACHPPLNTQLTRFIRSPLRSSGRPIIEMCIPSVLDPTLAPPGQHVVTLFVQYAPYNLASGSWKDGTLKEKFADHGTRRVGQARARRGRQS